MMKLLSQFSRLRKWFIGTKSNRSDGFLAHKRPISTTRNHNSWYSESSSFQMSKDINSDISKRTTIPLFAVVRPQTASYHEQLSSTHKSMAVDSRLQTTLRRHRIIIALVFVLLSTTFASAGFAVQGLIEYHRLKNDAQDALVAINHITVDLGISQSTFSHHPITFAQLMHIHSDLHNAKLDIDDLHHHLLMPDIPLQLALRNSRIASIAQSALLLSDIGHDALNIADEWADSVVQAYNALVSSPLLGGNSSGDVVTTNMIADVENAIVQTSMPLAQIEAIVHATPPPMLFAALSLTQQLKVAPFLNIIPILPGFLEQLKEFLPVAGPILGIGTPANYLIITLDPSELRASGGFQGNYGILSVQGAQLGNFSLRDIDLVDKSKISHCGPPPFTPPKIYSWWPFCPFGTRDANLSPDFPTSAQLTLSEFQDLGGNVQTDTQGHITTSNIPMTAMIAIQPSIIEQLLRITGPIYVGDPYYEMVTANNLQSLIHYYQLTNAGRAVGTQANNGNTLSDATKRFTALLGRALIEQVRTLTWEQVRAYFEDLRSDLSTKAIQIYFTNSFAEQYILRIGAGAPIYRGNDDAFSMNISNIGGNKGNMYYGVKYYDVIQLNAQGGATHHLLIYSTWSIPAIINGTDKGKLYPILYNADSVDNYGLFLRLYDRFYLARSVILTPTAGFDEKGLITNSLATTHSDITGRAMIGGEYKIMGDPFTHPVLWNVPIISLTWQAPNIYLPGKVYTLYEERQSGLTEEVSITILPPNGCGGPSFPFHYNGPLKSTLVISLPTSKCSSIGGYSHSALSSPAK